MATALQLISSFQNCELKQESCTLPTYPYQPLKFHNRERRYFFHIRRVRLELFRNSYFKAKFCFNSKPSFSFDSWRQRTKFPVASADSCNHKKNRFRVKTNSIPTATTLFPSQDICLSVPSCLSYTANEIPVSFPYRDTGTIRESYQNVMEKISGFLWERYISNLLMDLLLF